MTSTAGSWSFTEADGLALTSALQAFVDASGARTALLVDRAGQLVSAAGDPLALDVTAFVTLTAAHVAAADQLARLAGEAGFGSLVQLGARESMVCADVVGRVILVARFDRRTTLGLVRLSAGHAVRTVAGLLQDVLTRDSTASPRPGPLTGADDEIDRLFG